MRMGMFQTANCLICFIQIQMELNEFLSVTLQTNSIPIAERQQDGVNVLNLSWPAVSQICISTFLLLILMILYPQSRPIVFCCLQLKSLQQKLRTMEVLPTLLSPIIIYLTISSYFSLIIDTVNLIIRLGLFILDRQQSWMSTSLKGKQIKDYVIGQTILQYNDMHVLEGRRKNGSEVTILMIQKKHMQQQTFVPYNNLLSENNYKIHPTYYEAVQSTNNIYIVIEKIQKINPQAHQYAQLLPSIVELYRRMGEYKLEEGELFVNAVGKAVYMPFYKKMQMTSKFYAQFHNKSVLGDVFSRFVPVSNKNIALDIFLKHIDHPKAVELILAEIASNIQAESNQKRQSYPGMEVEESDDDDQIMQLMSKVKVNSDLKKEAGEQFIRLSAKKEEVGENSKQIKSIMENVQSSMFQIKIKASKASKTDKTKMQIKSSELVINKNQFEVYFKSYFESLRFLKKSIKSFLSFYKNGFAGIISSFLIVLIVTLRKAYMIKQLLSRNDIFQLGIDMNTIPIHRYEAILRKEMKSEAKMLSEFKSVIETCSMPMKTYSILAPYLQQDLSLIDFSQLQSFTFFFLSALIKNKDIRDLHFLYVIDSMYIILHQNYQIVFFESDFPKKWNQQYLDEKVALIEALVPSWSLS